MHEYFSPAELALLDSLEYRESEVLRLSEKLRREGLTADQVAALLTQAKLRQQAATKFGDAARSMLLTRDGLEQATRRAVAEHHARRFREAGIGAVADLGCGLGADSAAFARAGLTVTAYEIDPRTAAFTAHNLSGFSSDIGASPVTRVPHITEHPRVTVHCADVNDLDLTTLADDAGRPLRALWLDPARRESESGSSRRVFDPEAFSPPFSLIRTLAAAGIPMGVKMGPGMDHSAIPPKAEAEWISHGGEVAELVLWFNALARPGVRRAATLLDADPLEPHVIAALESSTDFGDGPQPPVGPPNRYLYEPDGAVIRAELVDRLAEEVEGHLLDSRIAYVTSKHARDIPWATGYRIVDELPLHVKAIRAWATSEGVTQLTVKKRGVDIVPEKLRQQVLAGRKGRKKKKGKAATLLLTRWDTEQAEQRTCFVVEPLSSSLPK